MDGWKKNRRHFHHAFGCEGRHDRLPSEMEITIIGSAQEGINNVLKHASATEAILQLQREAGAVRFSIFDNAAALGEDRAPPMARDSWASRAGPVARRQIRHSSGQARATR